MQELVLVRYGEIALKGANRYKFEDLLVKNITRALAGLAGLRVWRTYGRIFVTAGAPWMEVARRLELVPGVVSFSPAMAVPLEMEVIREAALQVVLQFEPRSGGRRTFKVETRRPYKNFPLASPEINQQLGAYLLTHLSGWQVDVHHPEVTVQVEVREEGAYVNAGSRPGPGGLPVGITGKGILLLSGGIDSPVAGWLAMKRGVEIVALHFYSFPFTGERSREKVLDLGRVLSRTSPGKIRLYLNHFTDIQTAIRQLCPEEYYVTIMRRMMLRLAEAIAAREGAIAVFTGESLGQVASQTLGSMRAINEVATLPVLRPLLAFDKQEIVSLARKIDTFDISIRPYEDCCTLFLPRHPATYPDPARVRLAESRLDVEGLLRDSLARTQLWLVDGDEAKPVREGIETFSSGRKIRFGGRITN